MPEYGAEMKMKAEETQQKIKEKFPEYLKPVLESITPELMTRSEEYVVPELKYQLEPMGFKFDETVPGLNAIKITAPNGNSKRFELSAGTKLIAESISNDVKEFVQRNVANIPTSKLSSLENQYKAENRKFKSEKEISEVNATIQNEAKSYINEFRNFENEARMLLSEEEKLNQSSDSERSSEEYARRALEAQRKRLELQTKEADLLKRRDSLIGKDKSLEIAVGKYVTTKEEQGTILGSVIRSFNTGMGRELAWAQSLVTDIGAAIMPDFMVLGESQWKDAYIKEAQKRGIPLPPKDQYGSYTKAEYEKWLNSLDEDVKDELHDAIIDETQKEQKYTKLENGKSIQQTLRESINEVLGPKSTTEEYVQDIKKGTVGNAILGAVESIPAFLGGGRGTRGAALRLVRLFGQAEDAQFEKMENNPNFDDISESEKRKISIPIAITTAVLEEIGFRNIIANKGMLNGITMRALGKAGTTTTARSFGELVKNEVNSMVAKGVLTLTGAALAEAETGALQQIAEYTVEDIYNVVKDKKDENGDYMKMFDTPDSISEYVSGVAMAGLQEAIGGFVLGVPSAVSAANSKKGFLNMDDDSFHAFERIANDDNMMKSYVSSLKSKVSAGTLTMAQAKEQLNEYRNAVSVYNKLPEGLSIGQKKEAMNLIKERSDLETQIQGKDEALVKPQKDRINAINESLNKISENAIQEQSTAEGLLRTEQSEVGLPQMGQGSEIITDEEKEKLKAERNVDLFPEQTEFANQIGGSGSSSTLSDYSETNGIGVATYSNPTTGQVDVIMSGTTDNDYVGFVRVYENGKPTNRFTSKMSNESGNKGNFVTMISQAQAILPEGHEYTETTNISLDGLRVFSNQLNRGYEVVTDESGNPVTSTVTLNAASAQGLRGAQTQEQKEDLFTDAKVTTQEEFDAINKQVTELMPQATATWNKANNTVSIQLPVLRSTKTATQATPETQAAPKGRNMAQVMENTIKSLKSVMPNIKVHTFKTFDNMKKFANENYGGDVSSQIIGGQGGLIIYDAKGKPIAIMVNEEIADATTMPHEAWHAILFKAFGDNPELFNKFRKSISKILREKGFDEIANQMDAFSRQKAYMESNTQSEEWLVQLGGLLTASGITPDNLTPKAKGLLTQIKELINEIAVSITGQPVFLEDATPENVLDFMVSISDRMSRGESISDFFRDVEQKGETGKGNVMEEINRINEEVEAALADNKNRVKPQMVGEEGIRNLKDAERLLRSKKAAEDMEKSGIDKKTIYLATGFERGKDGRWRFELPYGKLKKGIRRSDSPRKNWEGNDVFDLSDIFDAPELFEAYPEAKDFEVIFENDYESGEGAFDMDDNRISVSSLDFKRKDILESVLIHEIQHYVQKKEGFETGANPASIADELYLSYKNNGNIQNLIVKKEGDSYGIYDPRDKFFIGDLYKTKSEAQSDLDDYQSTSRTAAMLYFAMMNNIYTEHDAYELVAGEVEARNASRRAVLKESERKESTLEETEDRPRDRQVIVKSQRVSEAKEESFENSAFFFGGFFTGIQRRGIGKAIINDIFKKNRGLENILLYTQDDAIGFWKKVGGEIIKEGKDKDGDKRYFVKINRNNLSESKGIKDAGVSYRNLDTKKSELDKGEYEIKVGRQKIGFFFVRDLGTINNDPENIIKSEAQQPKGEFTVKSQRVVVDDLTGYEEMMDEVEFMANEATKAKKLVERDSKRAKKTGRNVEKANAQAEEYKANFDKLLAEAKAFVSNSATYQEADDIQKDKLIRDVEVAFGISQKSGPSPAQLFGDVKLVNKLMETIDFLFDDANKSKDYLAEVYQKARQRYLNYKNSEEYQRNSDRDVRLKSRVVKAKQEMDEYANKNTQEAVNALTNSEIYKKASPEEQKRMLEYLKDKFSKSQKTKILPTQLFRDIVDVKMITMSEKAMFIKQIKDLARGAKDAITAWKTTSRALAKQMDDLVKNNKITDKQMVAVLKRFSAVDMNNETSIENFVEYMTKVFNDAEYANKIEGLAAKRKAAKKNILTKLGVAEDLITSLDRMLAINPYLIPDSVLDDYIYLLDMLGDRAAVLNLADKSFVQNKVNDVMNEVNASLAFADYTRLIFDAYADKVVVDGKVSYSKTLAKMLKDNVISERTYEFMKKYKSKIMPAEPKGLTARGAYAKVRGFMKSGSTLKSAIKKVAKNEGVTEQEVRDMLDELGKEKIALIKQIRSAPINGGQLAMRDERALAAKLKELIKTDGIKGLEISELEILAKVIGNINSGFISNSAQQIAEKIESVNNGSIMYNSLITAKLLPISKAYAKLKKVFVGTTEAQISIERNPLFYVDQVIGDFKTKNVFNALFKGVSQAQSNYTAEMNKINEIINKEIERISESLGLNPREVKKSSYKMMAYMIEREFQSNPDLKTVHSAAEFLEVTIKEIDKLGSFYNENDREMLQEVLNEVNALKDANGIVDLNNFLKEFNKQEKDAINTFTNINNSMGDKALFTASVIRGSKINLINNYVHRDVLYSSLPGPGEIRPSTVSAAQNAMMPSTAAGTLEERTEAISPINFSIFSSMMKGTRNTLLDYHMTAPVRTARMALSNTEQKMDELNNTMAEMGKESTVTTQTGSGSVSQSVSNKKYRNKLKQQRQIFNALKTSFETILDDVLVKNFEETTWIDDVIQYITKAGYRSVLAGAPRFLGELSSNFIFATIVDPMAMKKGVEYISTMMSPDLVLLLNSVDSTVTQRVVPSESLSGSLVDTGLLNKSVGIKNSKTKGTVVNKMQQIYNLEGKGYVNTIELVSDFLISTPDKMIVRPLWIGSFANELESLTGEKVDKNVIAKIAMKDEAYMSKYKNEIARATEVADNTVIRAAASNNPFMGILKNRFKSSKGVPGAFRTAFIVFNSYMTNFLTYEYITARTGIYAAMGNGMISKQKGIQMLAGVTSRMMIYSALTKMIGNALASFLSGVDDDDEDKEESFWQNLGQLFASSASALIFGRDFGNATKTLVNYGIEGMNEKYFDFLREGEYDRFDDAIAYSILNPGEDQRGTNLYEIAVNASGPFRPTFQTADLIARNIGAEEKAEPGARQRQIDEQNIRIPLEIAGNAGLVPFYKDIRKAVNKSIYASIKEDKKAEEAKSRLLDSEWSQKKDKEVEALQKMLETETDLNKINIIRQKIGEAKMSRKQYKDMLETQKGERQYKAQLKESLLGGYEDMYELKRYDPELYEKNFGENSDYYKENKDEMEVEKQLNKTRKAIRDVEEGYVEPSKKKTYRYGPQDESDEGGSKSEYRYGPQDGSGKKGGKSEYKYGPQ